jgi:hypothetical protein
VDREWETININGKVAFNPTDFLAAIIPFILGCCRIFDALRIRTCLISKKSDIVLLKSEF